MKIEELSKKVESGQLKRLHTSYFRGYISRVTGPQVTKYKGRFGEGYAVRSPNWGSTRYAYITYYVR